MGTMRGGDRQLADVVDDGTGKAAFVPAMKVVGPNGQQVGTDSNPQTVKPINTQDATAQTAGYPTLLIFAQDKDGEAALMGVYAVPPVLPNGNPLDGVTVAGNKQLVPANASRRGLTFQNTSDTEMRVTENGTAATSTTGYQLAPGGKFTASTNRAINVYCATAGKAYAATEW